MSQLPSLTRGNVGDSFTDAIDIKASLIKIRSERDQQVSPLVHKNH